MSKIYVDEMPKEACQCPFAYMSNYVPEGQETMVNGKIMVSNGYYEYGCFLENANDTNPRCALEYGGSCDYLKELPKGDKENGSEED